MSCDIHLYCEYRKDKNSEWQSADYFMLNTQRYDTIRLQHEITTPLQLRIVPLYDNRNYDLFAILANVRNDQGIICIKPPADLPGDVSFWVQKEYDEDGVDAHSASYLHRSEIVKYLIRYHSDNTNPYWMIGIDGLRELLYRMERRMADIFQIYGWEQDYDLAAVDDNFRIVFWFDN